MFEVEPNLWLQSFATPWLTWLMQAVSLFGQEGFYAAAVLVAGFGLRLRPMLGVMLALLLTGLGTHAIKDGLGLPRPVQVDARVLDKGGTNTRWLSERGGARTAFGLPSQQAIAAARAEHDPDFGFTSGHVAAATAFCVSLLLASAPLRRRRTAVLAIALWPALMAVSRLYLGRHFLGDVLGGACLGLLGAGIAWWLWRRASAHRFVLPLALSVALASCAMPLIDPGTAGQLLGLALLAVLMARGGWPHDAPATPAMRLGRVALAFAVLLAARGGSHALLHHLGDGQLPRLALAAAATLSVLGGTVWLARWLRLYPGPAA